MGYAWFEVDRPSRASWCLVFTIGAAVCCKFLALQYVGFVSTWHLAGWLMVVSGRPICLTT